MVVAAVEAGDDDDDEVLAVGMYVDEVLPGGLYGEVLVVGVYDMRLT